MAVPIRSKAYHDEMGRTRHFWRGFKRAIFVLLLVGGLSGIAWIFLGSSLFAISHIQVSGADGTGNDRVAEHVQELLDQRRLHIFQPARNILLLRAGAIAGYIQDSYAAISQVVVSKDYPHTLHITITEREPVGVWCRGQDCQFFDTAGVRWGQALRSSGPLLLLVNDERSDTDVPPRLSQGLHTMIQGLPELGLVAKDVSLPDAEPGDVIVKTAKGYDLYIDAFGDVADQLQVLRVFLADRAKDPAFAPAYIDLRTPGRVYYK